MTEEELIVLIREFDSANDEKILELLTPEYLVWEVFEELIGFRDRQRMKEERKAERKEERKRKARPRLTDRVIIKFQT